MTPVVITKMLPLLTTLTGLALPWVSAEMAYATVASLAAVVEIDVVLVANVDRRITAPGCSKAGLLNRPRGVGAGDKVVDWRKDNNRTGCPRRRRGRSKAIDSVSRRRCEHTTKRSVEASAVPSSSDLRSALRRCGKDKAARVDARRGERAGASPWRKAERRCRTCCILPGPPAPR